MGRGGRRAVRVARARLRRRVSPAPRRPSGAAREQTRIYGERAGELAAQLRSELAVPERPGAAAALVVLMGFPGVGKSHCARLLARRLGAVHVASDDLRGRLFVAASYAEEENATIFRCIDALVDGLLGDGHRVVADATHLTAGSRASSIATARRRNVPILFAHVVADEPDILARLAGRRVARDPDDRSDADERVYERMRERFEPPAGGYLELRNGPELEAEIERIAREVDRACVPAI